ncbi:DUF58 domain-containing protein [Candidatus Woesearchaeota archaeon]|nr:DUF58 domain-containing protein [Candidatus Woesearchaeota archaeon]
MIDTNFLNSLGRFSLIVNKRVTSNYTGQKKSFAVGRGMLFKDHRMYAPGDDFRSIDWKVFARTDHLYIKNYEEERSATVHVIVDKSSSMNFGKPLSKFEYASMIGVGFAYLGMKDNSRVQFSTFSDDIDIFQPRRGLSQTVSMVHYLNDTKTQGYSKLNDALKKYRRFLNSRSLVILISDFLVDKSEIKESLCLLGKTEAKIIQVLDPVEKNMSLSGDFDLRDSETGLKLRSFITPRLKSYYQEALEEHSNAIEKECSALGLNFYQITTDTPIFDAFFRMLAR